MLRIVIDNIEAVIDDKTSVDFIKQTQFFWLKQERSFAYNHSLPHHPVNDIIFKFAFKLHKKDYQNINHSVQYYWKTVMLFAGTLKLNKTTDSRYEVYAGLDDSDVFVKIGDKNLADFDYGGRYNFDATTYDDFLLEVVRKGTDTMNDVFFTFPVINKFLYESNPYGGDERNYHLQNNFIPFYGDVLGVPGDVNEVFPDAKDWIDFVGIGSNLFTNDPYITPFLRLNWWIKKFANTLGYTVHYNFFETLPETRKLCIYSNREIAGDFEAGDTEFYFNPNELLPEMKAMDFITSLEYDWGVTFWWDSVKKTLDITRVTDDFKSATLIEFDNLVTTNYEKDNESVGKNACIKLQVDDLEGIAYTNKIPVLPIPIIEVSSTGDVVSPVVGQVVLVTGSGYWIYKLISKYPDVYDWDKYYSRDDSSITNYFDEYCAGTSESLVLESKCSPPDQDHRARIWYSVFVKRVAVPYINCPMVGKYWQNTNSCGMHLMIYEGITYPNFEGEVGDPYELPTDKRYAWGRVDLKNANQNIYTRSTISLRLNNDEQVEGSGMVANFQQDYLSYIGTDFVDVTRYKKITPEELNNLSMKNKYRMDQVNYIIKVGKINVQLNKMSICELQCIKTI